MEAATRLAFYLDVSMLQARSVKIADENVPDGDLPYCTDLHVELGGRYLIKYVRRETAEHMNVLTGEDHFPGRHFLTPTPISANDLVSALALPPLGMPRGALLLHPEFLPSVRGPRRIAGGLGVEYIAEDGIPAAAIVKPGWALEHR